MASKLKLSTNESTDKTLVKTIKLAEKLISFGLMGRRDSGVISRAKMSNDYFNADHEISSRASDLGNKVYNKYGEIFENKIAYYTSSRPKWKFSPQEEGDILSAKALNQILGDIVWNKVNWEQKGEESNLEAAHAGSCHIKPGIDPLTGYPTFSVFPCESVIPDPGANTVEQLQFFGWITVKTPAEILRDYGKKVDENPASIINEKTDDPLGTFKRPIKTFFKRSGSNLVDNVWLFLRQEQEKEFKDELGRLTIVELWIEDLQRERIPFDVLEVDEEHQHMAETLELSIPTSRDHHIKHIEAHQEFLSNLDRNIDRELFDLVSRHIENHKEFPQRSTRYKYPDGRFITITNGQVLRDEPNGFGIHWRDMLVKFDYLKVRSRYWGKPMGQDLFGPQDDLNHRRNMITQNINLLQNGIRKIKKGLYAESELSFIDNLIGRTIEVTDENDFTVDFGRPLPSDHWRDVQDIQSFMDRQAGNTDVLAGRLPAPGTAGTTVDQLVQQSGVRFSLPLRHYAAALEKMARISITLMSNFLDDSEVFDIMGQDNEITPVAWGQLKERFSNIDGSIKDIRIDIASLTSTTREKDEQQALQRLHLGAYDVQAYLEKIDDPAKYQILQRMSKIAQLSRALEQAAEENKQLKKSINTLTNRLQSQGGEGNVGSIPTGS